MSGSIDIALLQTRPMGWFDAALAEAMPLAETAVQSGAEIIFLPEYCGGLRTKDGALIPPAAPEEEHPILAAFQQFARNTGVWINLGSIAVKAQGGKIINRGYMLDDKGEIVGRYDKIHLFDVQLSASEVYQESAAVTPGDEAVLHRTPFGTIGHTICYDLRFPHLYRTLAQAGADILICPAAFTKKTGEAHWHVLNRARAIENTRFMISACAVGPIPGGGESFGHSLVINPWGDVVADGGKLPGVVHTRIDLGKVSETAQRIPSLSHDREYGFSSKSSRRIA